MTSIAEMFVNMAKRSTFWRGQEDALIRNIVSTHGYHTHCCVWKKEYNAFLFVFEDSSCIIQWYDNGYVFTIAKYEFGTPFIEIEL